MAGLGAPARPSSRTCPAFPAKARLGRGRFSCSGAQRASRDRTGAFGKPRSVALCNMAASKAIVRFRRRADPHDLPAPGVLTFFWPPRRCTLGAGAYRCRERPSFPIPQFNTIPRSKHGSDASSPVRFGRTRTKLDEIQTPPTSPRCNKAAPSASGQRGSAHLQSDELPDSQGRFQSDKLPDSQGRYASAQRGSAFAPADSQARDPTKIVEGAKVPLAFCKAAAADELRQATAAAPRHAPAPSDDRLWKAPAAVAWCTRGTLWPSLGGREAGTWSGEFAQADKTLTRQIGSQRVRAKHFCTRRRSRRTLYGSVVPPHTLSSRARVFYPVP